MDEFEQAKEEQERKRELYQQQQKARLSNSLHERPSLKENIKQAKEMKETAEIAAGAAGGAAGVVAAAGKVVAKKVTKTVMKEGVQGLAKMAGEEGGEHILNALWISLFTLTPLALLSLVTLHIYALASSGILNMIWPDISKKLAPFGLYNRILPFGLGKILGIIVLVAVDILILIIILIIIALLYFMTNPIEGFKDLYLGK